MGEVKQQAAIGEGLRPEVTRFAPSPTGRLHRGHAFSAVLGWAAAQATQGRWLLRIEDVDRARCRPEHVAAIHRDLAWLGLAPDGPVVVQSQRREAHDRLLGRLIAAGMLYGCRCTRADIAAATAAPHAAQTRPYPGTCRGRPPAAGEAWRLDLAATGLPLVQGWEDRARGRREGRADLGGDPVLRRKDGAIAYHLAAVADDAESGVTLVVRGDDLVEATPVQRLLQTLLAMPVPRYLHHPLIADAHGRRLAKRDRAATLEALREAGEDGLALRDALLRQAAPLLEAAGLPI
jgi:glutamyl-Q tRNA(Asp) synthetase